MLYEDLRYNEVRQISSHNAFQRFEGIYDQVVYWRIRSLEIDPHRGKPFRNLSTTMGHSTGLIREQCPVW